MIVTKTNEAPPSSSGTATRRIWLIYGLAAALLAVAAGAVGWWAGSGGEDTIDTPQIVEKWTSAFIAGDAEAVGVLYTEDAVLEEPGVPAVVSGRSAIQAFHAQGMQYADWAEKSYDNIIVSDDVVVMEGENSGMSRTPARSTMTPFSTQVITVLELEDGLVSRAIIYYDPAELFN